jgi:hypothetical protein
LLVEVTAEVSSLRGIEQLRRSGEMDESLRIILSAKLSRLST